MKKRLLAVSTAALCAMPICARSAVLIEQIEANETGGSTYTSYAPIEFGGSPTYVSNTGQFAGITFKALDTAHDTSTASSHALYVADYLYAGGDPAYPYVSTVYCEEADDFLANTVGQYYPTGVNLLPGSFAPGVQVVNNSYDGNYDNTRYPGLNLDTLRRIDYMINKADVTFVAGTLGTGNSLVGASFNSLEVSGSGGFSPSGSPAKQHADLFLNEESSYGTGTVSGYVATYYGVAQAAGQTDAQHSYLMRSLLLAGTDKTQFYSNPGGGTAGGMNSVYGAGVPNFYTSLAILQAGEKSLLTVGNGSAISGTPATVQEGWATGNVSAGTQDVVLFQSTNALTAISASLNWNVTSQTSGGNINTSSSVFPNLTFEVRPVTYNSSSGKYVLGTSESNQLFHSAVTGDNTQYIYSNTGLPAGSYALLITGDASLPATVGVSYTLSGSFATQWNSSAGGSWGNASLWTNGIPNGQAAQANLLSSPGLTAPGIITLDGDRTVGQLTFNNPNGYTIAQGTVPNGYFGQLTIDDTGDSTGTVNPLITVSGGSQTITLPILLANGVTTSISSGCALNITGSITGSGALAKTGAGTLTLGNTDTYGSTTINGGTVILTPTGSLTGGPITINTGGTLNFAASITSGILTRNLAVALNINTGGTVVVAPAAITANRQLIITPGGVTLSGSLSNWTGKLDLNNNDLDIPNGNLATLTNQLKQGYNSAHWNGTGGIVSSSAANNTTHLTALGIILNTTDGTTPLYSSGTPLGPFDAASPAATDVLIKYTWYGDANLDGKVDGSDYARIDNGSLMNLTGWYNGDFNYDGVINGSDYTLIDNAYNTQGAQLSAEVAPAVSTAQIAVTVSVPEPSTLPLAGITAVALLRRRIRSVGRATWPPSFSG